LPAPAASYDLIPFSQLTKKITESHDLGYVFPRAHRELWINESPFLKQRVLDKAGDCFIQKEYPWEQRQIVSRPLLDFGNAETRSQTSSKFFDFTQG
jgi:hypothetical protein